MKNKRISQSLLSSAFTFAVTSPVTVLQAQEAAVLEEIVVSAQKREQQLQNVGIVISTYNGETLRSMGVNSSNEIAAKTPNLTILSPSGEGGVVSIFIRGIGLNDYSLNNTGPVGFYVDGSSISSTNAQLTTLFDIERVEILKGPQGTLFGRNTTGGALNIISNKPTDEFEASLTLDAGNYGYIKTQAVVSGPLSKKFNTRVALVNSSTDGYMKNLSNNNTVEKQHAAGRVLLDYLATDELTILLNVHGSRNNSDSDLYGTTANTDFYQGNHGAQDFRLTTDTLGASINVSAELSESLSFTSITSYGDVDKTHAEEADMTPLTLVENNWSVDTHTFSQELRLNASAGSIQWIAGLYYLSESINWASVVNLSDMGLGIPLGNGQQSLTTQAAFGQLEYDFFDRWVMTLGTRYTSLDVTLDYDAHFPALGALGLPATLDFSDSLHNNELSGKAALNFHASEDVMLYGSIARGFKGGGFNGGQVTDFANYAALAKYDPETLTAYELGLKSTLLETTLRFNAAIFLYDYQHAQVFNSFSDPVTRLPQNLGENAESLNVYGLDVDINWQPLQALYIQAGIGYTHSEFDQYHSTVSILGGTSSVELSGQTPQNTPEYNANILANYTWQLSNGSQIMVQFDGSYQSQIFFSNGTILSAGNPSSYSRNKEIGEDSYSLWNTRISWTNSSDRLELAFWSKNLADREYATYMFELSNVIGADQVMRGVPRTYGIDVAYRF